MRPTLSTSRAMVWHTSLSDQYQSHFTTTEAMSTEVASDPTNRCQTGPPQVQPAHQHNLDTRLKNACKDWTCADVPADEGSTTPSTSTDGVLVCDIAIACESISTEVLRSLALHGKERHTVCLEDDGVDIAHNLNEMF